MSARVTRAAARSLANIASPVALDAKAGASSKKAVKGKARTGAKAALKSKAGPTNGASNLEEHRESIGESASPTVSPAAEPRGKKRKVAAIRTKHDPNALPHGLSLKAEEDDSKPTSGDPRGPTSTEIEDVKVEVKQDPSHVEKAAEANTAVASETPLKGKKAPQYRIKLGETPYPDLERPTLEDCYEVNRLLSEKHGKVQAPESVPVPSRTVAGCGEVKYVLEALVRTCISAHTSNANANRGIQGILKRYPTIQSPLAPGSVDWNAVRLSCAKDAKELEKAISAAGMGPTKSVYIKGILDKVYEENKLKRAELVAAAAATALKKEEEDEEDGKATVSVSAAPLAGSTDRAAIMTHFAEKTLTETDDILTLDYMHAMPVSAAFEHFLTFPGIGVKTAACVLLFCMQQPFFAVDTHVYRLSKWLGWVPPKATRDTTFAHGNVRVPDELKYSLHQLLITHGKDCVRCRANARSGSAEWEKAVCPLEHLMDRTAGNPTPKKKKAKKVVDDESDRSSEAGPDDDADEEAVIPIKKATKRAKR